MAKSRSTLKFELVKQGLCINPKHAEALVLAGKVRVNGGVAKTAGQVVVPGDTLEIISREHQFVSRGGTKLQGALERWGLQVSGLVCADVGASTGGFTDVLLRAGAAKIFAIDVAYGELAWEIRSNPKVVVLERTNARELSVLPEPINFAVVDVSFISLRLILPRVVGWFGTHPPRVVALIKPQFEAPRELVPHGGVIVDAQIHADVILAVKRNLPLGLRMRNVMRSPITGREGNVEFLALLDGEGAEEGGLARAIEEAVRGA